MKIRKKYGGVSVSSRKRKMLISPRAQDKLPFDKYAVCISLMDKADEKVSAVAENVIINPGEYELSDILITAVNNGNGFNDIHMLMIDMDDIKLMYLRRNVAKIDKTNLDNFPDVNIMIMEIAAETVTKAQEQIRQVDPQVIIPVGDKLAISELAQKSSLEPVEAGAVYKIKATDFSGGENMLDLVLLDE